MSWSLDDIRSLRVHGLDDAVADEVKTLLAIQTQRFPTNRKRTLYCDTEQAFRDLGIGVPPQIQRVKYVLGWAAQAVKKPAMRSQFDGLRLPGSDDPFELGEIFDANRFALEFGQAIHSAYKHGVSFVTVGAGDSGECPVQIIGHSAESAAGRWDRRSRRLASALTISDADEYGEPTEFVVYLPDRIVTCQKNGSAWVADSQPNPTGRVMCVPVLSQPELTSPLGVSRLSNSAMQLTDMAVRTLARMEGNAEFYSSPQVALLGLDREAFADAGLSRDDKFRLAADRVIALTKDGDGDAPVLQQLTQASMTPHSDMMRTLAMAFSGETGIPPSSLGVIHDQPASAEAIRAAEHDLLIDVTNQNENVLPYAVKDIAALAVMVRDGVSTPPDELWRLSSHFSDPEFGSIWAEADAVQKLASSMQDLSQWPVLLERVFTQDEVARVQSDAKSSKVSQLISSVANRVGEQVPANVEAAANARGDGSDSVSTGPSDGVQHPVGPGQ